ncbi:transglutaminase-like domain-containing protein [Candidatus Palauibacter sp.]|uniref:transglutaminase-like domain-containing protein n=1 Tax=Candidatus Palauibacter sp. TaxID=3101350 RepID=UPI003B52365D
MASILRDWGIPARYVSGYLGPGHGDDGGVTTGESHAWVESWLPGVGWIGFDPTNDTQCDDVT